MSLTARPQMRGAMQLLFSLLDFKMTNTVKMLKTRPNTVITMPPKEATRADVSLKDELEVILAITFQDWNFPSDKLIRVWRIGNFRNFLGNPWREQVHIINSNWRLANFGEFYWYDIHTLFPVCFFQRNFLMIRKLFKSIQLCKLENREFKMSFWN